MNEQRALKLMKFLLLLFLFFFLWMATRVACGVRHAKPNFPFTFEEEWEKKSTAATSTRRAKFNSQGKAKKYHTQTDKQRGKPRASRPYQ